MTHSQSSNRIFLQHHIKQECNYVIVACPNGCGEKVAKKDVSFAGWKGGGGDS